LLTDEEKDALGEVGNICMGSSSTTLSMLLNQPVNITSPRVTITTMEELLKSFVTPHMSIRVRFIEGLSGYNLLIMRVQDAAVLADLMMGGDGISTSDELTEIGISAASEAMNQMIGAASTAMATMFSRTVNISPPVTKIYHSPEELTSPEQSQVVVVWFKMTIGSVLDTQIMQVMDMDTAREEAGLILGQLLKAEGEECLPAQEEPHAQVANHSSLPEQQTRIEASDARPPAAKRSAATQSGLDQQRLGLILDIPLKVTVLLGRTRWPIKDILELTPGSVVELQSLVDEPVEVLINGTLVAMGEVVVVNENFGVRLTNIIKPEERLQKLRK
ncbi:MAG TPA: flagellar motor switch phosphatase FliY, partial [Pelotomaculum sp.]|nr:flagellar motor switch phosphatase FliY [Pelotomaculum sp.]